MKGLARRAIVIGCLLLAMPSLASASLYAPGATTDPDCGPVDSNCGIRSNNIGSASSTSLYWDSVHGYLGVGTSTPFKMLTVAGDAYIQGALSVGDATTTRAYLGLTYATNGEVASIVTPTTFVTAWGDSLTAGNQDGTGVTYPNALATLIGRIVNNKGVGGQTSTQIAIRQGAVQTTATVSGSVIPASGGVTITFPSGYEPVTSQGPSGGVAGTIAGVYGTVTYSGGTYTFTRNSSGDAVSTSSAPFIVDTQDLNGGTVVIWAGRNNVGSPDQIKSDVAAMVSHLGSNTNYLVLSVLNTSYETSTTTNYATISALNAYLASTYSGHYLDIRTYLINHGLADAGLTPTAQDGVDISNDVMPTSLLAPASSIHLNHYGYAIVAQRVANFISGTLESDAKSNHILLANNLEAIFASTMPIGTTKANSAAFTDVSAKTFDVSPFGSYKQNGSTVLYASTTINSIALGSPTAALWMMASSSLVSNIAIGTAALGATPTGATTGNIGIGVTALSANLSGADNVGIGRRALQSNLSGGSNVAVGANALQANSAGTSNSAVGAGALYFLQSGAKDTALGYYAGIGSGTTPNNNRSLVDNGMTFLGAYSSRDSSIASTTVLTSGTAIGYNAKVGGSNMLALGGVGVDAVKVGIGTSTPFALLSISSQSTTSGTTPLFAIATTTSGTATTTVFLVSRTGDTTISGSGATCTIGNSTTVTCTSDEDLKDNITVISDPLTKLDSIKGVTFTWKDRAKSQRTFMGLLAQDVQSVFPEAVTTNSNGDLSVDYGALVAPVIEGVKELAYQVNDLAAKVTGFQTTFTSKQIRALDELCVGSTCIDEQQLKDVLRAVGATGSAYESPAPSTTTNEQASTTEAVISETAVPDAGQPIVDEGPEPSVDGAEDAVESAELEPAVQPEPTEAANPIPS